MKSNQCSTRAAQSCCRNSRQEIVVVVIETDGAVQTVAYRLNARTSIIDVCDRYEISVCIFDRGGIHSSWTRRPVVDDCSIWKSCLRRDNASSRTTPVRVVNQG